MGSNLAATQLGITISSLALGWVGEPALAHLIEPTLYWLPGEWASTGSHTIAVVIAFVTITSLHIVLGEPAPESFALQRSEATSLGVVRPLGWFLVLFKPAIYVLNGMGNLVLRAVGLNAGTGESSFHSPQELKLLVMESQEAGLLNQVQQQLVERVFNIGERPISDIMTPRLDVDWFDAEDSDQEILTIRECRHEQLLVGRGSIAEPIGMVFKRDLLDQVLNGGTIRPMEVMKQPLVLHEATSVVRVLDTVRASPVRLALVIDEYGSLEGIVTQTDLLEAIAGDLHGVDGQSDITVREDGSMLIDAMMFAFDAFERLGLRDRPDADFHTLAGFAIHQLQHIPVAGETFDFHGWRFEIVDMDGMRIDKILATRTSTDGADT